MHFGKKILDIINCILYDITVWREFSVPCPGNGIASGTLKNSRTSFVLTKPSKQELDKEDSKDEKFYGKPIHSGKKMVCSRR